MANGVNPDHWWAKSEGGRLQLGKSLQPLAPFEKQLTVVKGLRNALSQATGSPHEPLTGTLLSGADPAKGSFVRGGTTIDQVLAQRIGQGSPVPSLVLGTEAPFTGLNQGYSYIYGGHISWSSPTTPVPTEIFPSQVFDRLFRTGQDPQQQYILDAVGQDARRLQSKVSAYDRDKLDQYFTSISEIEKRMKVSARHGGKVPSGLKRPKDGLPQDNQEHMRLMLDFMTLAFQANLTRVCTLMLNRDQSSMVFPQVVGVNEGIHAVSHTGGEPYQKLNAFHVEQLAYACHGLSRVREGARNLLENSTVLFCSSLMDGGKHDATQLPVVLVGGGGGTLKGGRALDFSGAGNRKMCSLYLSLMDRMGVTLESFGDSQERLPGL